MKKVISSILCILFIIIIQSQTVFAENNKKAYLVLPDGWQKAYAYIYNDSSSEEFKENNSWPGIEMDKDSEGIYYISIPDDYLAPKIIFNDGNDNKYPMDTQEGVSAPGLDINTSMILIDEKWMSYSDYKSVNDKSDAEVTNEKEENNSLCITSFNADKSKGNINEKVMFTVDVQGGSNNYQYYYYVDGDLIEDSAENKFKYSFKKTGEYEIKVKVIDNNNGNTRYKIINNYIIEATSEDGTYKLVVLLVVMVFIFGILYILIKRIRLKKYISK